MTERTWSRSLGFGCTTGTSASVISRPSFRGRTPPLVPARWEYGILYIRMASVSTIIRSPTGAESGPTALRGWTTVKVEGNCENRLEGGVPGRGWAGRCLWRPSGLREAVGEVGDGARAQ